MTGFTPSHLFFLDLVTKSLLILLQHRIISAKLNCPDYKRPISFSKWLLMRCYKIINRQQLSWVSYRIILYSCNTGRFCVSLWRQRSGLFIYLFFKLSAASLKKAKQHLAVRFHPFVLSQVEKLAPNLTSISPDFFVLAKQILSGFV